jgi:hypothetical protein
VVVEVTIRKRSTGFGNAESFLNALLYERKSAFATEFLSIAYRGVMDHSRELVQHGRIDCTTGALCAGREYCVLWFKVEYSVDGADISWHAAKKPFITTSETRRTSGTQE